MASVRERNGRFVGLYRSQGRQRSAGTFSTREEALARAQVAELDARPTALLTKGTVRGKQTVFGYAPGWLEGLSLEPNTRGGYQNSIKHIVKRIGGRAVADVTTEDIRGIIRYLEKLGRKDATIHHVLTIAFLIFESAVRAKLRDDNPCAGIKHKIKDQREMRIATREQEKAIENAIPERYKLLVRALFATGCRWSEMIAIRGTDVEHQGNGYVLHIRRTVNETWKVGLYVKPYGKSLKATRDITLPAALAVALMSHGDKLCFTNTRGGYLRRADFRQRAWKPAVTKAGIPALRVHDCRHTAISRWANTPGIPLSAVRDRAGHSNITTTSKYIHFNGDDPFAAVFEEAA